jgi:apolipoprotein N-acyltransferase
MYKYFGFSFLSAVLLYLAWPPMPFTFCIFIAFLPLLYFSHSVKNSSVFFVFAFTFLLMWNIFTTWWIWNSTAVGSIFAIVANSLVMYLPWWGYFKIKNKVGNSIGYLALISFWMLFEYIHLNWDLSWPWLSLGNVFANKINWIQWYEYTGVAGGTLWILMVNILLFEIIKKFKTSSVRLLSTKLILLVGIVFIPILISFQILQANKTNDKISTENVVIVQPNIDPYLKFENNNISNQISTLLTLTSKAIDSNTNMVIWPETALSAVVPVDEISKSLIYKPVFDFAKQNPKLSIITGIETYKIFESETPYTQKSEQGFYYESYNAAIVIQNENISTIYIKSKLVPGVETLPKFMKILSPIFEQFGGTTGGYAKDETSKVFNLNHSKISVAPVICYESIYGEYVGSYIKKGANLISIITNDGWWGNTAGHKQHLAYAKLRAVETRCWIVRSANTGISAVINANGEILNSFDWNKEGTIKYSVPLNNTKTFYVLHGDYLYKICSIIALLFIGWFFIIKLKRK